MSLDFTDDQSTLVQVMARCREATSHTWANVDLDPCRHMASLGHNALIWKCDIFCQDAVLTLFGLVIPFGSQDFVNISSGNDYVWQHPAPELMWT